MSEAKVEVDPRDIHVASGGFHAALEALMMEDPHPKGYLVGTAAARIDRALWAYEWANATYPIRTEADGRWCQRLPRPGEARAAVLAKEAHE